MADQFLNADAVVKKLNATFQDHIKVIDSSVASMEQLNQQWAKVPSDYLKVIKTIKAEKSASAKSTKDLTEAERQALLLEKQLERQRIKLTQATSNENRELVRLRTETQRVNREVKESVIANSALEGAYKRLNLQRTQASQRLRDLIASGNASNAQLRRAQQEFNKLDARVRKADLAVRDHTKNVGNYRSALGGLSGSLRSLMGAFGLVGGIYLFARALRDAFSRIREFDKAMQNLAGITGMTRDELKPLETVIMQVAGSSIKTSNEVADLATTLITLGKTPREVRKLLKPTNDLAIALKASSEGAGELLVSTLNAFGESSDEAQRYADVIAKMRTSTALDFERIQVSMSYIAPTARALGMTVERTGAMLGVLVDNGIKAQRAGRLMSSSFAGLAARGITLEQALERINNSTDKVVTAQDLFGTQAFTLGLILADNTDKMDDYTKSFENSAGALESLTNEQLKSMDAQLKILDSTWERFILSIEQGSGPISSTFSTLINGINQALIWMTKLNDSFEDRLVQGSTKAMKRVQEILDTTNSDKFEEGVTESVVNIEKELLRLRTRLGDIQRIQSTVNWRSVFNTWGLRQESGEIIEEIGELEETIALLTRVLNGEDLEDPNAIEKAIKGLGVETNKTNESVKGSMAWLKAQISELERLRDTTATTSEEYASYAKRIDEVVFQMQQLDNAIKILDATTDKFSWEELEAILNPSEEIDIAGLDAFLAALFAQAEKKAQRVSDLINHLPDVFGVGLSSGITEFFTGFNMEIDTTADKAEQMAQRFEKIGHMMKGVGEIAVGVFGAIKDAQNVALENQIRNLETQRNIEIAFAGDSAEARGQIEERFAERKREIQQKQARNSKAIATMEAVVSTAVAVVKALAVGPPQGIILAALVGALGAAQIGAIASTPIPQFKDGVRDFGGGMAVVGDGGKKEPITDKKGKLLGVSPNRPTLVNLPKGANVYSSEQEFQRELNGILSERGISPSTPAPSGNLTATEMEAIMRKTLGSQATLNVIVDKSGVHTYFIKQNAKLNQLNNRVTGKGRAV